MKKQYVRPMMVGEKFLANEYCTSTCGASGTVYKFQCNAGRKKKKYNVYYFNGTPYCTTDDNDVLDKRGIDADYYHPCDEVHEADSNSIFIDGYMYEQGEDGDNTGNRIDVVIWTNNYTNCHCTTVLGQENWEVLRS